MGNTMLPSRFTAHLRDGSTFVEDQMLGVVDTRAASTRKGEAFKVVQGLENAGLLKGFSVDFERSFRVGVDLDTGAFLIGDQEVQVVHPGTPLRLIYYKQMRSDTSGGGDAANPRKNYMHAAVIGWQTTVTEPSTKQLKNIKLGVKVYPAEKRWEVSEDI